MIRFLLIAFLSLGALASYAQSPGNGGPIPTDPATVPLDGGASLLLASGAAYGLRRISQHWRRA